MNNAVFNLDRPTNEPILSYMDGSEDRRLLVRELERVSSEVIEIPLIIGGKEIYTGDVEYVVMPHNHKHVLAKFHKAGEKEINMAIDAANAAHKLWSETSWIERISTQLKIAELIATKYRYKINATTMLGQGKNIYQAEIDSACEAIDFLRFNAYYANQIYSDQPMSGVGTINRTEYRPLEGFVFAVTPFNFTAIASNLPLAPALMGNTVVWKPSNAALLSNYLLMQIYKEAGIPDGVINFIPGNGPLIGKEVFKHRDLAGVHFTGSTAVFNTFWENISKNIANYKSYPKIVGETGGKDFIFVHNSANPQEVATAMLRGSFEYQGQKCSAASRSYVPESMWNDIHERIAMMYKTIKYGDVSVFSNFMGAVIDEKAYDRIMGYINIAKESDKAEVIFGGNGDKSKGYFIEPTIIKTSDPHFVTMEEEIFGPVLTIYVYQDDKYEETLELCDKTSPYALTGSIFAIDRNALSVACRILKYAAGNFYYNDKPSGAVVGQQPFGGSRSSGTNDKAGSNLNLLRWISPRTIKETLVPATTYIYPYMKE